MSEGHLLQGRHGRSTFDVPRHPRGEFQGIPPTDKHAAFSSIEINLMVDGKVMEHWFEMDLFGLMQQLGTIPEPEHSDDASSTSM